MKNVPEYGGEGRDARVLTGPALALGPVGCYFGFAGSGSGQPNDFVSMTGGAFPRVTACSAFSRSRVVGTSRRTPSAL